METKRKTKFSWRVNLDHLLGSIGTIMNHEFSDDKKFFGPTLFIGGSKSPYFRSFSSSDILQKFPNAEIIVIPGADHYLHHVNRFEFEQILHNFLQE